MAKIVFGPTVGDARNKIGGTVFTKTRFGAMIRAKVSPTQPHSSSQQNVRANFTSLSKLWSGATMDSYRAGWVTLADTYPVKDVFGKSQRLTGHQMFVRLNRALETISISPILAPPATLSVPYPGAITLTHDGPPVVNMTINPATWLTASERAVLMATPGTSPGRATAGARFRYITFFETVNAQPFDFLQSYINKFGTPITGRKIFVRLFYTNLSTGAQSLPSEASITI